jgi:hypothetical protein
MFYITARSRASNLKMLKIKPFQKTFLSETMQRNYMYYFSASPPSHEFRTKIESQIGLVGPRYSQNKMSTPSFVTTMYVRQCQCSIYFGDHRSREHPTQHAAKRCSTVKIFTNMYLTDAISHCLDVQCPF